MTGLVEAGELLDVDLQERAWSRPLVAAWRRQLRSRSAREAVPPEHLPDRRACPAHDPGQPAGPVPGLPARGQDRLLLERAQLPRRAARPTRTIVQGGRAAAAIEPAMPPAVRGRRRGAEGGRGRLQRKTL